MHQQIQEEESWRNMFELAVTLAQSCGDPSMLFSQLRRGLPKAMAIADGVGGKAVVFETDGRVLLLRAGETEIHDASGLHLGMLFQSEELITCEAGQAPYAELSGYLNSCRKLDNALSMLMVIIDSDTPQEVRTEAIASLEEMLNDPEIEQSIRTGCMHACLPPGSNLEHAAINGKVGALLADIEAKWSTSESLAVSLTPSAETAEA